MTWSKSVNTHLGNRKIITEGSSSEHIKEPEDWKTKQISG